MQVNFFAFKSLVDSIDGVNVYFNYPARDSNTGSNITSVGCSTLDGDQALAFARSRHYTAELTPGVWTEDPTSDHGRIARQQYFIKQALKKAIAKGARNPIELNNLIGVAQKYVKIDKDLTGQQILDLGAKFNSFNPDDLQVFEPYTHGGMAGAASVLFLDPAAVTADVRHLPGRQRPLQRARGDEARGPQRHRQGRGRPERRQPAQRAGVQRHGLERRSQLPQRQDDHPLRPRQRQPARRGAGRPATSTSTPSSCPIPTSPRPITRWRSSSVVTSPACAPILAR